MANFKTAFAMENEIFKAADFNFGYDSIISNIATAMKSVLSGSEGNYVIGGKVTPYGSGGMNVSIAPMYAFCNDTDVCVAEGDTTEPISFEESDDSLGRIDIIEVCGTETGYDPQSRKFIDPSTGTETTQTVNTKKKIALTVVVKKGSNGSESAPAVDAGYIKIAEVAIPAGTNNITEDMIKNVDARKYGVANTEWTTNAAATFNPGYLAEIFYTYLVAHNEDGTHKNSTIKAVHIDFGTNSTQVKGSIIPAGQSMAIHGIKFTSSENLTNLILELTSNVNSLYEYSNDLFSRFSWLDDFPVAASTENVDIITGGEMTIDGIACTIGQKVFLKDQMDPVENGFYEVQSGAWNRYPGYGTGTSPFSHKFVSVVTGASNAGKIFYLNGDLAVVGTDSLEFQESILTSYAKGNSLMVRDADGRCECESPSKGKEIVNKSYLEGCLAQSSPAGGVATVDGAEISVTIPNFTAESLYAGATVKILCPQLTTASPTLNVNSLGAYPIKAVRNGGLISPVAHTGYWGGASSTSSRVWDNNTTLELIFTGSVWVIMGNPVFNSYYATNKGYTVYSNGLIEQWGEAESDKDTIITLLVKYSDSKYNAILTPTDGSTTVANIITRTTSGFYVQYAYGSTQTYSRTGLWHTIGY